MTDQLTEERLREMEVCEDWDVSETIEAFHELIAEYRSLRAEVERLRDVAHMIAHEAHTEGRIYARGGEKETPGEYSAQLARMVVRHLEDRSDDWPTYE